jgi:hypothetical protein
MKVGGGVMIAPEDLAEWHPQYKHAPRLSRRAADDTIPVSGPCLSMPVLVDAFPQGLEAHDPEHTAALRLAAREWDEDTGRVHGDPAIHHAWVRFIVGQTVGFPDEVIAEGQALPPSLAVPVPEYGETLRPDLAILTPPGRPDAGTPRLLV